MPWNQDDGTADRPGLPGLGPPTLTVAADEQGAFPVITVGRPVANFPARIKIWGSPRHLSAQEQSDPAQRDRLFNEIQATGIVLADQLFWPATSMTIAAPAFLLRGFFFAQRYLARDPSNASLPTGPATISDAATVYDKILPPEVSNIVVSQTPKMIDGIRYADLKVQYTSPNPLQTGDMSTATGVFVGVIPVIYRYFKNQPYSNFDPFLLTDYVFYVMGYYPSSGLAGHVEEFHVTLLCDLQNSAGLPTWMNNSSNGSDTLFLVAVNESLYHRDFGSLIIAGMADTSRPHATLSNAVWGLS